MSRPSREILSAVLDLARWAPSGDNSQPWRFEILADDWVVVHGFDTREHCIYDLDGHASQLALGALLETMRIAATRFGLETLIERRRDEPEARPTFDVRFVDRGLAESDLVEAISIRSVQRRPLSTRPLRPEEKRVLEASVGSGFELGWRESLPDRFHMARLLGNSAKLRLTLPEAFLVHRAAIEPNVRFSVDRVPDQAIGLDSVTLKVVHWAMRDWRRMSFMNKYLAGTWTPRLQLDFIPALACAAHVFIRADKPPQNTDDFAAAGAAVQRLWLSLTRLGLLHQPAMTPLIFSRYARQNRPFSFEPWASSAAADIGHEFERVLGPGAERIVWLGRIGHGRAANARSIRLPLEALLTSSKNLTEPLR